MAHPRLWSLAVTRFHIEKVVLCKVRGNTADQFLVALSCLSVRPHGVIRLLLEGFCESRYSNFFSKIRLE